MNQQLIDQALQELRAKPRRLIERETAFKWAARAVAAYQLAMDSFNAGSFPPSPCVGHGYFDS